MGGGLLHARPWDNSHKSRVLVVACLPNGMREGEDPYRDVVSPSCTITVHVGEVDVRTSKSHTQR